MTRIIRKLLGIVRSSMGESLRTETDGRVRSIVLARPEAYNTITFALRDELAQAIDDAEADDSVNVILLRAEGAAFCAGYGLDWSTAAQDEESGAERVWDPMQDFRGLSTFTDTFMKLWYAKKPTIAAVQGWCIAGGTDLVLCCDIIVAGEGARFGYPPARVWGVPTAPLWVHRLGAEKAKRFLLTGDEIPARDAAAMGLILQAVGDGELQSHAMGLAKRIAMVPMNQTMMIKLLCNQQVTGIEKTRTLAMFFDGVARHTPEGVAFVDRSKEVGFRQAVRERDDPFGDYGSRKDD
ncbi:MAG: crotonase/enoyl-CoA hydratase family protein [Actinomycetota bacterium]